MKTRVISARVPCTTADKLQGCNLREILEKVAEGVAVDIEEVPKDVMDDLRVMVQLGGGTFGDFMVDLHKKLDEGSLTLKHGRIDARLYVGDAIDEIGLFIDRCKDLGYDPKGMMLIAVANLEKI